MPKYRLTYFEAKARAEISRMIFAAAGQEYEDRRLHEFTEHDYIKINEMKEEDIKNTDEWLELKAKLPFGHVPVLEVDGHMIAESKVIATFLARRLGLAGKTDIDDARAAMLAETINDNLMEVVYNIFAEKDKEKQAKDLAKYASETLPNKLTQLEKQVGEKGHFVADQLTYADISFHFCTEVPPLIKVEIDWSKYPKLKAVHDNVEKNPGIAKWLKERPQTQL